MKSRILAGVALAAALASFSSAQDLGNVALRTVNAQVANNVTCTGAQQTFLTSSQALNALGFRNLGQTAHQISATSNAASFTVEIDGVDNAGSVGRISGPTITFGNGSTVSYFVQGSGYVTNVQISVLCTAGATFTLSYNGSFGSGSTITGAPGSPVTTLSGTNVQGVTAKGQNGTSVFPLMSGGLGPPTNSGFTAFGVDNFSASTQTVPLGFTGNISIGVPPSPSTGQDFAFVFYFKPGSGTGGTGLQAPWTCQTFCGASANVGNASPEVATIANVNTSNTVVENIINNQSAGNQDTIFVLFQKAPTIQQNRNGQFGNVFAFVSNTLVGSTLLVNYQCAAFPCQVDAVTDTQGNAWKQLASIQNPTGTGGGSSIWMTGPTSAAAETVTATQHAGTTINGTAAFELAGTSPANPNQPTIPMFVAPGAATGQQTIPNENDQGGVFTEVGGFSVTQTLTITTASTTSIPLWDITKTGTFSSCYVEERVTNITGAATTLNTFLQDSADNVGFNDRLSMPQATTAAGAQNLIGATPAFTATSLAAVASSAVVSTNGTLAAGSAIAGPIGAFGRIQFVTTGAAVNVTVTYNVLCR